MRDGRIDLLRVIGLAMIVLAHAEPGGLLFQLRNFDVPLMVLVAGLSFRVSYRHEPYARYLFKRFKRLVLPVWLFLTVYFAFVWMAKFPIAPPSFKVAAQSYLLLDGIGYVWIIRVFLMVACVAPLLDRLHHGVAPNWLYFGVLAVIIGVDDIVLSLAAPGLQSGIGRVVLQTVFYLIPYAVIFSIGIRLPDLSGKKLAALAVVWLAVFVGRAVWLHAATGGVVPTQQFKYPPRLYYVSYALCVSVLAWMAAPRMLQAVRAWRLDKAMQFIAENSIWIYLWHIPFIAAIRLPFYAKFPIVFVAASTVAFVQIRALNRHLLPNVKSPALRRHLHGLLTG